MRAVILAFSCVCAISAQEASSGLGQDPWKFDLLVENAWLKRDLSFLENAVAPNMRYVPDEPPRAIAWGKHELLGDVRYSDAIERNIDSVRVEQHGDLVETQGHVRVKTNGGLPEFHIYFARRYQRGAVGWQLISHETTRQVDGPLTPERAAIAERDAPSTPPGVYRPGNGVSLPRVLREVKPQYTQQAMRQKIQGTVLLECLVNPNGIVEDARVIRSVDTTFGLDDEAIKAAKQWRFAPGTLGGQPVPVLISIELRFTLR